MRDSASRPQIQQLLVSPHLPRCELSGLRLTFHSTSHCYFGVRDRAIRVAFVYGVARSPLGSLMLAVFSSSPAHPYHTCRFRHTCSSWVFATDSAFRFAPVWVAGVTLKPFWPRLAEKPPNYSPAATPDRRTSAGHRDPRRLSD